MVSSSSIAVVRFTFSVLSSLKEVISNSLLASFSDLEMASFAQPITVHPVELCLIYFVNVDSFIQKIICRN
jgi:hypothetical protein